MYCVANGCAKLTFFVSTGQEPVDSWYDEIKNYDFGRPGFRSNTGNSQGLSYSPVNLI